MSDQTSKLLAAATTTFEQLGFLFAETELEEWQKTAPLDAYARVGFVGPMIGAVEVKLTHSILANLAANMLGAEESVSESEAADALGEVANVICGNLLPAIAGPHAVFDLSVPEVALSPETLRPASGPPVSSGILGVEEGRTEVSLYISDPGAAAP